MTSMLPPKPSLYKQETEQAINYALEMVSKRRGNALDSTSFNAVTARGEMIERHDLVTPEISRNSIVALRNINPTHEGMHLSEYVQRFNELPDSKELHDQFEDAVCYWTHRLWGVVGARS